MTSARPVCAKPCSWLLHKDPHKGLSEKAVSMTGEEGAGLPAALALRPPLVFPRLIIAEISSHVFFSRILSKKSVRMSLKPFPFEDRKA